MTDLTEQWEKGELPEGDYFITDGNEIYLDYYDSAEGFLKTYNCGVLQVLAPVPSYEEWQAKLEENTKLKGLLKEVLRHDLSLKEVTELTRKISQTLEDINDNTRLF